jgi:Putative transmembrane protein (PGPGW)
MDFLFSRMTQLSEMISRSDLIILLGSISLLTFAGTLLLLPILLIRIPEDYFLDSYTPPQKSRKSRVIFHIVKNLLGFIFFLMGIIMLFIPGQGLLTMLAGLLLMDLPGKRRLEIGMIRRKSIYTAIDLIRKKASKASLILPENQ